MMTLKRFKELTDSYGGESRHWPEELRDEAAALLRVSPQARELLAEAQTLDEALEAASAEQDAVLWPPGEESAALARLRSGVSARLASLPRRQSASWFSSWTLRDGLRLPLNPGAIGMATSCGLAVVAGLLIGSMHASAPAPDMLTMLQPAPLQIFQNE